VSTRRAASLLLGALLAFGATSLLHADEERYQQPRPANSEGIGKFYMGREIAHVMGHPAADWLERAEREQEERPDLLYAALDIKPGMQVADIGAGTGYHARRFARQAGAEGTVYAVDIQPEMLQLLQENLVRDGIRNVKSVLGKIDDARLPAGEIDLAVMVDVYHEFEFPYEMMQSIVRALKPGGRIAFVEFKAGDANVPIRVLHTMSEAQIRKEAGVFPLRWVKTVSTLPWQHVVIFEKKRSQE
jgi:ubiquinone/menaquinone biosynthesis C-methylase UbiE